MPDTAAIETFLRKVDSSFPVALSQKQNLHSFAAKLHDKATLCVEFHNQKILGMVAGYIKNTIGNRAYITVVATLEEAQRRGLAGKLMKEFMIICKEEGLEAVHLYTAPTNTAAVNMYRKLGFVEWNMPDEPRPEDIHFIYYIKKESDV